jgi:tetratricopeptide (TPR) repeat protein
MRLFSTIVTALVLGSACAQAQSDTGKVASRPLGPGAFFLADGPNPFAGPVEAVTDCMFFSKDVERKIKGCSDVITDAGGEPRQDIAYRQVEERRHPKNLAAAYYHRALGYREKGNAEGALADLDEAIRLDAQMPKAFDARGRIQFDKGRLDPAVKDFNEAVRLEPNTALFHHHRGTAYSQKGEEDLAIADFGEAIRLDPKLVNAYYNRGEIHRTQGRLDLALRDLDEVIRRDAKQALAYHSRGQLYGVKGQIDQAIADFTQAIGLAPNYAPPYASRAVAYYQKGELQRVVADAGEAVRLDPKLVNAYVVRGLAQETSGSVETASADYKKALVLDPSQQTAAEALKRLSAAPKLPAEHSELVTIETPRLGDLRLDWCREWSRQCGKAAADEFCRRQGFAEAAAFARASRVGERTQVIGTGQICHNPSCDGFASITCR